MHSQKWQQFIRRSCELIHDRVKHNLKQTFADILGGNADLQHTYYRLNISKMLGHASFFYKTEQGNCKPQLCIHDEFSKDWTFGLFSNRSQKSSLILFLQTTFCII